MRASKTYTTLAWPLRVTSVEERHNPHACAFAEVLRRFEAYAPGVDAPQVLKQLCQSASPSSFYTCEAANKLKSETDIFFCEK